MLSVVTQCSSLHIHTHVYMCMRCAFRIPNVGLCLWLNFCRTSCKRVQYSSLQHNVFLSLVTTEDKQLQASDQVQAGKYGDMLCGNCRRSCPELGRYTCRYKDSHYKRAIVCRIRPEGTTQDTGHKDLRFLRLHVLPL
jgi:hypothetical protein